MNIEIVKGPVMRAQRVCVYGPEGVGKTTFASKFPKPLFLDLERGSCRHPVDRVYARSVAEVEGMLHTVAENGRADGYETLVVDTVDALWWMVAQEVAAGRAAGSIEEVPRGVDMVSEGMARLLRRMESVMEAGMHVVVLAHADTQRIEDEEGAVIDRCVLRLHSVSAFLVKQAMDAVLYASFDGTAGVEGRRVLRTVRSAGHDAKNRQGLPDQLNLSRTAVGRLLDGRFVEVHPWDAVVEGFGDAQIEGFLQRAGYLQPGLGWRSVGAEVVAWGLANRKRLHAGLEAFVRRAG